jgi:hypothetical protein
LANVLIAEKFASAQALDPLLQKVHLLRTEGTERTIPVSLIALMAAEQLGKLEDILSMVVDKSKLPYLPLSIYDVDREIACLLPQDICWEHCIVPFDLISRSVMIATANPFDQAARQQAEAMLDYSVFWYVSPPADIVAALRRAHGLDGGHNQPVKQ